jgi:dTDP-4-amino-4,6-dideoxygalactose transaminase
MLQLIGRDSELFAEEIATRELTLPLYPTMTIDEVDLICDSLIKALEQHGG